VSAADPCAGTTGISTPAGAAELQASAAAAYDRYVDAARAAFVRSARPDAAPWAPPISELDIGAASPSGRIVKVPGGLVHHWGATVLIPGVDLSRVIAVAQNYDEYSSIYRSVVRSRLLVRDGDTFHLSTRLKEDVGFGSVVLDLQTVVTYVRAPQCAYAIGAAVDIPEVEHADAADERRLPVGHDSGYLWKASTFTRFVEVDRGVLVELETIGLSRGFRPIVRWLLEPVARRLGRSSVERTLAEFRAAVMSK